MPYIQNTWEKTKDHLYKLVYRAMSWIAKQRWIFSWYKVVYSTWDVYITILGKTIMIDKKELENKSITQIKKIIEWYIGELGL